MDFDYDMDQFDNYCIWIGILDKSDPCDYQTLLSHFIQDVVYLSRVQKAIHMARYGYIEKSKEKSHVFIFYMKNGDVSVLNQEQLLRTNEYNKLYFEATYSIERVIELGLNRDKNGGKEKGKEKEKSGKEKEEKENDEYMSDLIMYRDYLVSFISYHVPHLIV